MFVFVKVFDLFLIKKIGALAEKKINSIPKMQEQHMKIIDTLACASVLQSAETQ